MQRRQHADRTTLQDRQRHWQDRRRMQDQTEMAVTTLRRQPELRFTFGATTNKFGDQVGFNKAKGPPLLPWIND